MARRISMVSRVRRTGLSKCTPCQPSITLGQLFHTFHRALQVGVHLVEPPAQDAGLLAGMGGDGHGGAGRPRAHDIGEAQARAARAWFELEAPPGAWLAGVGGAPTEGAPF